MSRLDKPRQAALVILREAERGAFVDPLLDDMRRTFVSRDSAFILELVYGVLRNRSRIDWLLERYSAHPLSKTDDWTRNILRLAAYQLLFLDKVPASAAVNTATELAKSHGKKTGYVNGLLRSVERNKETLPLPADTDVATRFSIRYSHPVWLVRRWINRLGPEPTEEVLRNNNKPAPLATRANRLKGTRDELISLLTAQGAEVRRTTLSPEGVELLSSPGLTSLPAFQEGRFSVQDEAAQLICLLLAPQPGEHVLDACAAPGGKATHLAEMMNNRGKIVALESDRKRLLRIDENAKRLGISIIHAAQGDAAKFSEGEYDRILIDAPCSGLGVLRRHPDGRWTKTVENLRERAKLQARILENCATLLKSGGIMVYATCTTEPEENENIIRRFLDKHPEFRLDDPRPYLPAAAVKLVGEDLLFRTFPSAPMLDGFFGARIKRER